MNASPSGTSGIPTRNGHLYRVPLVRALVGLGAAAILATGSVQARDLTFQERVAAQEAIERVYYSHQIGVTLPFQEVFPR